MGEILSKNSDQISATAGAIIGSLISPGIGTIIGGLSGGSISVIINAVRGNNGGGFSVSYHLDRGVSVGYYNEVKDFVSKMNKGYNAHSDHVIGLIKNYDYSQIVFNSQFKEKENISTGHMVGSIKNYDYSQEKDNSQFEEKENINTVLNVTGLIISGIEGYAEGMEQKKGVKNNFYPKFIKLKIINVISFF